MRQVILNGRHYNYVPGSYNRSIGLKNSSENTQNSRTFSVLGLATPEHTITLALETKYMVRENLDIGETTWNGTSRLYDLVNYVGANGSSLPILFVTPEGITHSVVPMGSIDVSEFLVTPLDSGVEWRVNLTLAGITNL